MSQVGVRRNVACDPASHGWTKHWEWDATKKAWREGLSNEDDAAGEPARSLEAEGLIVDIPLNVRTFYCLQPYSPTNAHDAIGPFWLKNGPR
jgi:hypothetical protein